MTKYLLVLSIGPVQTMIAAARRSQDLWSGSWLLSELSKACAKQLATDGATLIFPNVNHDNDLQPNSEFSVGNKIQVIINANNIDELKELIEQAKQATKARFLEEAQLSRKRLNTTDLRCDVWDAQINDYVELQCAWVDLAKVGYADAVKQVGKTLAARKATRDFDPAAIDPYEDTLRLPKSSLDGMRETVLVEEERKGGKKLSTPTRRKLSLNDSEQLDSLGVIKRLGFNEPNQQGVKVLEQFTPITRVAADAWIQRVLNEDKFALDEVKTHYESLVNQDTGIATRVRGNQVIYEAFAFDAQYLYASRLDAEILRQKGVDDAIGDTLKQLKSALKPIWDKHGQPATYSVLLLADGDNMGKLLDNATSLDAHQSITHALSGFASDVAQVMRDHRGHCVYAGGDDVLGFVPLHQAVQCADSLQKKFVSSLETVAKSLNADTPTLSVGLAICHVMTPFSVVREHAKTAEKLAKGDMITQLNKRRNALGAVLSVRSGADTQLRLRWDDNQAHAALYRWITDYQQKHIPSRVAYDIRDIFLRTKHIARNDFERQRSIQQAELTRMLKQARTPNGQKLSHEAIEALKLRNEQIGLEKLANELIVARWFAIKTQNDLGKE